MYIRKNNRKKLILMKKIINNLYDFSRTTRQLASKLNDINTILSGDSKKVKRRIKNKAKGRVISKINNKIMNFKK